MDMIDQEIMRLKTRMQELNVRIIPDFEHRTQMLYAQIMTFKKGTPERVRLEEEYSKLSRELAVRSDELISTRQQIDNLEMEKNFRR